MRHVLPLLILSVLAGAPAAGAAERTRLGSLPNESTIRTHEDLRLVSVRGADGHRLALFTGGSAVPLPIPAGPHPIDADIGSDRDGSPVVVLSRCQDERRRSCDLFLHRIGGTGEVPIRNANSDASETSPTVWRGRVAWARGAAVYTRLLASNRSVRSRRLAGVPGRRCDLRFESHHSCTLKERTVEDLELRGGRLAQDVTYVADGGSGHYQREIRLADLRGGSRRVASGGTGEGGQDFIGLSFAAGQLGWHQSCFGDPCAGRAYRYAESTGVYQVAGSGFLAGFALTSTGFLGVVGGRELGHDEGFADCEGTCEVARWSGVGWRRVEARRIRD